MEEKLREKTLNTKNTNTIEKSKILNLLIGSESKNTQRLLQKTKYDISTLLDLTENNSLLLRLLETGKKDILNWLFKKSNNDINLFSENIKNNPKIINIIERGNTETNERRLKKLDNNIDKFLHSISNIPGIDSRLISGKVNNLERLFNKNNNNIQQFLNIFNTSIYLIDLVETGDIENIKLWGDMLEKENIPLRQALENNLDEKLVTIFSFAWEDRIKLINNTQELYFFAESSPYELLKYSEENTNKDIKIKKIHRHMNNCDANEKNNKNILNGKYKKFILIQDKNEKTIGHIKIKGIKSFLSYEDLHDEDGKLTIKKGGIYSIGTGLEEIIGSNYSQSDFHTFVDKIYETNNNEDKIMVFRTNNLKLGYLRQIGDISNHNKNYFTKLLKDFPNKLQKYKKVDVSPILEEYNY